MRIQHNIMAMNSYRNYTNNTSALRKNLEKLSSGYRINRAGDDAAGLAISEKMRAQITGLETAQKNAKDGISLVQTAEGALTEVHSMLNRMVELAGQSANGTYDNEVDRANLQKEVSALKSEIDRISDSANFNGIKLLDGSLGGGAAGSAKGVPVISGDGLGDLAETPATAGKSEIAKTAFATFTPDMKGTSVTYSLTVNEGNSAKIVDITLDVSEDGKSFMFNGENVGSIAAADGKATDEEQGKALAAAINKHADLKSSFKATYGTDKIELTHKVKGADAPSVSLIEAPTADTTGEKATASTVTAGVDAFQSGNPVSDQVFTVGGQKFMFASSADSARAADADVTVVVQAAGAIATGDLSKMADLIKQKTGYAPTVNGTAFEWKTDTTGGSKAGSSLVLQIGDTSDDFNKLTVSIQDMHTRALGINGIDISSQSGASAAVDVIKNAINTVSSVRGDLGATQNGLDHTINNLSVMTENIQDAESSIRDTDVAKEMMAYTKNNILIQSAQAMLAQANQVPQGVLQLMQ